MMGKKVSLGHLASNMDRASILLAAVGNDKRLRILCELATEETPVGVLAHKVALSQSALSQHLAKLRALNLVGTRRDAQTIYYSISSPFVMPLLNTLNEVLAKPLETALG